MRLRSLPGIPVRRRRVIGSLLFGPFAGLAASSCRPEFWPGAEATREAFHRLYEVVRERAASGRLARHDGYAYAVDVGELLRLAARRSDSDLATALRRFVRTRLVLDDVSDPFTRGFVIWRRRPRPPEEAGRRWAGDAAPDDAPDASGTTEALRVSEGLLATARAFDRPDDRVLALRILDGYARHAAEAHGLLLIRNYFNLRTRDFATNSFLVDYAPDHLARTAREWDRDDFAELATRSYEVVRAAATPTGLIYDVFSPEMATLFDDRRALLYSPNDIVQTSNAASIALHAMEGAPDVALRVLDFCRTRMPELRLSYYGRTGEPARPKRPGIEIWGTLTEMALHFGDERALRAFAPFLVSNAIPGRVPPDAFLYVAAHLLLGLDALMTYYERLGAFGSKGVAR